MINRLFVSMSNKQFLSNCQAGWNKPPKYPPQTFLLMNCQTINFFLARKSTYMNCLNQSMRLCQSNLKFWNMVQKQYKMHRLVLTSLTCFHVTDFVANILFILIWWIKPWIYFREIFTSKMFSNSWYPSIQH